MKKTVLFLLISCSLSAQIKGVVKDSITGKPIPYANIWVENENIGASTEENGEFVINTNPNKNLIFSALGFEKKKTLVSDFIIVKLKPTAIPLEEVVVYKPKNSKSIEIGNFKKAFYLPEPQVIPWIVAKKVNFDEKNPDARHINKITFYTKNEVDGAVFRVRIFAINSQNMPSEDILENDVIVEVKKGNQKTEVDFTKFNIEIPNEGVVVGFESLFLEKNKYIEKTYKKAVASSNYDPHVFYQYIDKEESYTYRKGTWVKQTFYNFQDHKVIAPAIKVTLTN